jgi:hypothetical protein
MRVGEYVSWKKNDKLYEMANNTTNLIKSGTKLRRCIENGLRRIMEG